MKVSGQRPCWSEKVAALRWMKKAPEPGSCRARKGLIWTIKRPLEFAQVPGGG